MEPGAAQAGCSLPTELQDAIILQLGPAERRNVASVCRHWEEVVRSQQRRLDLGNLLGSERAAAVQALLAGVHKRRSQLQELSAAVEMPEGWPTLAIVISRLDATVLHTLHIWGGHSALPPSTTLCLTSLRRLVLRDLKQAPPDATLLSQLTHLELHYSGAVYGWIDVGDEVVLPDSLAALRQLREISLSWTPGDNIDGDWMDLANPEMLARLPALKYASLDSFELPNLDWLQGLRTVTRLALCNLRTYEVAGGVGTTPFSTDSFSTALEPLVQLRFLDLQDCGLTELPASVAALPCLRLLNLQDNPLRRLPAGPYQRSLEVLNLEGVKLHILERMVPALHGMPRLAVLGIRSSGPTGGPYGLQFRSRVREVLDGLPALKTLHLSGYPNYAGVLRRELPALDMRQHCLCTTDYQLEAEGTGQRSSSSRDCQ